MYTCIQATTISSKSTHHQGYYRFLDPKFKTFSRLFPKNNNSSFLRTSGHQIGDNRDLEKYIKYSTEQKANTNASPPTG